MHSRNSCKTLKCPRCNWHYKYQETLEIHMKEKHPENELNCLYCLTNQSHPRLARGETYTCGYKPYRCEVCNYSTTTKGNLSIHMTSDKHMTNIQQYDAGAAATAAHMAAANKLVVAAANVANSNNNNTTKDSTASLSDNSNASLNGPSTSLGSDQVAQSTNSNQFGLDENSSQQQQLATNISNALALAAAAANNSSSSASSSPISSNQQTNSFTSNNNSVNFTQAGSWVSSSQFTSPISGGSKADPVRNHLSSPVTSSPNPISGTTNSNGSDNQEQTQQPQQAAAAMAVALLLAQQNPNALEDYINSQDIAKDSYDDPSRKYKCHRCKVAFTRQSYLTAHNKTLFHRKGEKLAYPMEKYLDPNRPFKCDICKESFTQKSILLVHNNSVSHLNKLRQSKKQLANSTNIIEQPSNSNNGSNNNDQSANQSQSGSRLSSTATTVRNTTLPQTIKQDVSNLTLPPSVSQTLAHHFQQATPSQSASMNTVANQFNLIQQQQANPLAAVLQADPMAALMVGGGPMAAVLQADPMTALMAGGGPMAALLMASATQMQHPMMPFMMNPQLMAAAALAAAQSNRSMFDPQAAAALVAAQTNRPMLDPQASVALAVSQSNRSVMDPQAAAALVASQNNRPTLEHQAIASPVASQNNRPMLDPQAAAASMFQSGNQLSSAPTSGASTVTSTNNAAAAAAAAAALSVQQQKRARTRISEDQLRILRQYFDINNSPTEEQLQEMSIKSELPLKVIKHWFRNTLFKERQKNKDSPYNFNNPPMLALNLEEYERTGEAKVTPISDLVTQSINQDQVAAAASTILNSLNNLQQQQSLNDSNDILKSIGPLKHISNNQADQSVYEFVDNDESVEESAAAVVRGVVDSVSSNNNEENIEISTAPSGGSASLGNLKRAMLADEGQYKKLKTEEVEQTVVDSSYLKQSQDLMDLFNKLQRQTTQLNNSGSQSGSKNSEDRTECDSDSHDSDDSQDSSFNNNLNDTDSMTKQSASKHLNTKSAQNHTSRHLRRSKRFEQTDDLSPVQDENVGIGPSSTWSPLQLQQQLFDQTWATVNNHLNNNNDNGNHNNNQQGLSSKTSDSSSHSIHSSNSKSKRANRTRFSDQQVKVLQEFFETNAYPKDDDLECLSKQLGLSPRVIVVWFQNARQKARKVYENRPTSASMSESDDDQIMSMMHQQPSNQNFSFGVRRNCDSPDNPNLYTAKDSLPSPSENSNASVNRPLTSSGDHSAQNNINNNDSSKNNNNSNQFSLDESNNQQHQQLATSISNALAWAAAAANNSSSSASSSPVSFNHSANPFTTSNSNLNFTQANSWIPGSQFTSPLSGGSKTDPLRNQLPSPVTSSPNPISGMSNSNSENQDRSQQQPQQAAAAAAVALLLAQLGSAANGTGPSTNELDRSIINTHPSTLSSNTTTTTSSTTTSTTTSTSSASQRDKRLRTQISPEQLDYLYQKYQVESNPSRKTLESIAQDVGLSKRVVQVWFQNTRARERRGQLRVSHVFAQQQRSQAAAAAAAAAVLDLSLN